MFQVIYTVRISNILIKVTTFLCRFGLDVIVLMLWHYTHKTVLAWACRNN